MNRSLMILAFLTIPSVALAGGVVVDTAPHVVIADDDDGTEINYPMFSSGALTFAASYGAAFVVAATDDGRGDDRLYVPLLGPWLALNDRGSCDALLQECDHETTTKVLFVVDGIFQAAGMITMLDSLLVQSHVHHDHDYADRGVHVRPVTMSRGAPGLAVFGSF